MDRIENIKKEQKKHLSYNLQMLRQKSGLSVKDFCDNTFLSHASYTRYINLKDTNIPSPTVIKDFCDYFLITPQQLLNSDLPEDYISLHPDIYFTLATKEDIDNKLIEILEHHYDIKLMNVIKAFAEMEIKIDFLPNEKLTVEYDKDEPHKQYIHNYTVDNFTRTMVDYYYRPLKEHSISKKSSEVIIAQKYIKFYEPIYISKYLLAKQIQKTKSIPSIIVRFRTLQTPTDIDPDIYKTIKTMSLDQFLKYCAKYKKQILDTFHINIPH